MQNRAAAAVILALAVGLPPRARVVDAAHNSQTIPQIATQASCPTLLELEAGPSTPVRVNAPIDSVWTKIREALREWSRASVSGDSKRELRTDATLIVEQPSAQAQMSSSLTAVARTCFYEWRTGKTDTRMAFKFSPRVGKGKASAVEVVVSWLSQTKGSAQRTWQSTRADSNLLNNLLDLLSKGSAN